MSYYIRDGVDLKEVPLHKVETLMNAGITIISDKDIIKELKQQLEVYKAEYNDTYANDLETLSIEQLRERIVLIHSWVKHHQGSIERKCKQYEDFKKEAVEVIELMKTNMKYIEPEYDELDIKIISFLAKYRGEKFN